MDECHHLDPKIFSGNCEIAQYCGHYLKRVNGVLVEGYWSDKDGKCIVPGTVLSKADSIRPDMPELFRSLKDSIALYGLLLYHTARLKDLVQHSYIYHTHHLLPQFPVLYLLPVNQDVNVQQKQSWKMNSLHKQGLYLD
jgi:hypothetical protein